MMKAETGMKTTASTTQYNTAKNHCFQMASENTEY